MSIRTLRLGDNAAAREKTETKPYEVYRRIDLGPVGDAAGTAADAKSRVADIVRKKYGR
ncbi:MAG: hypothetical protein OXI88_20340 [Gammaproteobacteria bacterium]|nr:hypothetical protein [Gammaproteobacteria bacterium]